MQTARIESRIGVRASPERIWSLIADLGSWDRWNAVESGAEGTIAFGGAITATESLGDLPLRPVQGRVGDWEPYAQLVWTETRGLWFRSVRYFEIDHLEADEASCIVSNGFIFHGLRGEWFFDKHRAALRRAVGATADGLKAAAEG